MPKGPPPAWSRRDCRFDHLVVAALEQGYGKMLVYSGIESWERADEIRRGIYRCAKHRGITAEAGPNYILTEKGDRVAAAAGGGQMGVRKTGKTYELWYRLWTKRAGRKQHLARYGGDRAAWPYDPRRGATPDERESWAARNERGQVVTHG